MTDESHNLRRSSQRSGEDPLVDIDNDPTLKTTPVDHVAQRLPDQAAFYAAPQPAPLISEHKTLDMVPVRLSPDVDPRQAPTQRLFVARVEGARKGSRVALVAMILALIAGSAWGIFSVRGGRAADATPAPSVAANLVAAEIALKPSPAERMESFVARKSPNSGSEEPAAASEGPHLSSTTAPASGADPKNAHPASSSAAPKHREVWLQ